MWRSCGGNNLGLWSGVRRFNRVFPKEERSPVTTNRRTFLQLLGAGAVSASFPASIARALEIPANDRTGTIKDVEHIVILMQENRSFDHYFGSLRGVRGFGDPRVVKLPNGDPVW